MPITHTTTALVLKRHNYKETDRVVTLITQPWGKITVIAKGARKLLSTKRGVLEPGNTVKAHFIETKYMPYLTQAEIISPAYTGVADLNQLKNLQLTLELFDRLLVEEELEEEMFTHILSIRNQVIETHMDRGMIRHEFDFLLTQLGYPSLLQSQHASITDFVAELTNKPLRSWEFLS
jgi:DNA repair protein RecO (recombination protein O)